MISESVQLMSSSLLDVLIQTSLMTDVNSSLMVCHIFGFYFCKVFDGTVSYIMCIFKIVF